MNNIGENR